MHTQLLPLFVERGRIHQADDLVQHLISRSIRLRVGRPVLAVEGTGPLVTPVVNVIRDGRCLALLLR